MSKLPVPSSKKNLTTISPLQLYLQEIAKYPLLEPQEEYELARKHFEESDVVAAHRLVTSNLRLVVKIANDFKKAQENLLDLIQEGNYGLLQAVKKFNPYKGVKLSSYAAWWIRAYILKYLLDNKSQVKLATTAAQRKLFYNLHKEINALLEEGERVDTKLIAERLSVPEKDVIEMHKRLSSADISLDKPVGEDLDSTRGDSMADTRIESIDTVLADKQVKRIFQEHLDEFKLTLEGREKEIFEHRLLSEKPLTLQELGDQYNITRERARQLEARLVKKLKEFVINKGTLDI